MNPVEIQDDMRRLDMMLPPGTTGHGTHVEAAPEGDKYWYLCPGCQRSLLTTSSTPDPEDVIECEICEEDERSVYSFKVKELRKVKIPPESLAELTQSSTTASIENEITELLYSFNPDARRKAWGLIGRLKEAVASGVQAQPHLIVCNYRTGPVGVPGCICEVVNKNDRAAQLEELDRWERMYEVARSRADANVNEANQMMHEVALKDEEIRSLRETIRKLRDTLRHAKSGLIQLADRRVHWYVDKIDEALSSTEDVK